MLLLNLLSKLKGEAPNKNETIPNAGAEGVAIGIDLGTTYSCAAAVMGETLTIISSESGQYAIPSVIYFSEDGKEIRIGEDAKRTFDPKRSIHMIKRFMGREYDAPATQKDIKMVTYDVRKSTKQGSVGHCEVHIPSTSEPSGVRVVTPELLSAMILRRLKTLAEDQLGMEVTSANITVPAYFGDKERRATIKAGELAELKVKKVLNEPTAASIAFGVKSKGDEEIVPLIFDLGGGTFDISVLTIESDVFETLATEGDAQLGGADWDHVLATEIVEDHYKKTGKRIDKDSEEFRVLTQEAEKIKRALSLNVNASLELSLGEHEIQFEITRAQFEHLTKHLMAKCIALLKKALRNRSVPQIDEVVLVGGSTRMPAIADMIRKETQIEPRFNVVNPDIAIAAGAAYQIAAVTGQATKSVVLLDVTPLGLGIETVNGILANIIEKDAAVPTRKTKKFTTAADGQTSVTIKVFESDRTRTADLRAMDKFDLVGLPSKPKGEVQVDVTFEMNTDGVLVVTAECAEANIKKSIQVKGALSMTDEQIAEAKADAEKYFEADKKYSEYVQAKQNIDSFLNQVTKQISEDAVKQALGDDLETLQELVKKHTRWLETESSEEAETYEEKFKEIQSEISPLLAKTYGAGAGGADGEQAYEGGDEYDL